MAIHSLGGSDISLRSSELTFSFVDHISATSPISPRIDLLSIVIESYAWNSNLTHPKGGIGQQQGNVLDTFGDAKTQSQNKTSQNSQSDA